MKTSELRNISREELNQKYSSLREELFNLRVEMKAGRIEKPHKLRELRRDIARVKTVIGELDIKVSDE